MVEFLVSMLSVAAGIVIGTLLTWAITYLVMRKYVGTFIRLVTNEPELHRILKDITDQIAESVGLGKHAMPQPAARDYTKDIREKTLP